MELRLAEWFAGVSPCFLAARRYFEDSNLGKASVDYVFFTWTEQPLDFFTLIGVFLPKLQMAGCLMDIIS